MKEGMNLKSMLSPFSFNTTWEFFKGIRNLHQDIGTILSPELLFIMEIILKCMK
jgi:hypothetical protein